MLRILEVVAEGLADIAFRLIPRRQPLRQVLSNCKIVSHRGEHDNKRVKENTMAAFQRVFEAGVWGIELDVRWTKDCQPVVNHDADTGRVFGIDLVISEVTLDELHQQIADIPSLRQVVERYGGHMHLMVELKQGDQLDDSQQVECLRDIFSKLTPAEDYHFIALDLQMFRVVEFAGTAALLAVAELNFRQFSEYALAQNFAGVSGHYLLLSREIIRRHHQNQQKVGTGFVASRFCFYRELNRGVDWIFTNHALKLRAIQQNLLRNS